MGVGVGVGVSVGLGGIVGEGVAVGQVVKVGTAVLIGVSIGKGLSVGSGVAVRAWVAESGAVGDEVVVGLSNAIFPQKQTGRSISNPRGKIRLTICYLLLIMIAALAERPQTPGAYRGRTSAGGARKRPAVAARIR